jgi:hypothetical protein
MCLVFAEHQPKIGVYAQSSPAAMVDVLTFVYLTVQQPLDTVATAALPDVRKLGSASRFLWGWKSSAYEWAQANKLAIYDALISHSGERERLSYLAECPGLGLVKAGFMVQLCFGEGGCIDTHNVERLSLSDKRRSLPQFLRAQAFKKAAPKTRARYLDQYQELLEQCGGAQWLWDDWCEYVAEMFPVRYRNADYVSELHLAAIGALTND